MYPSTDELTTRVVAFLGAGDPGTDGADPVLVAQHVEAATSFVRAYVRDVGFYADWPNVELASVIVSAAARSASNPQGIQQVTTGKYAVSYFKNNIGFTLMERAVLDRYRVRAR